MNQKCLNIYLRAQQIVVCTLSACVCVCVYAQKETEWKITSVANSKSERKNHMEKLCVYDIALSHNRQDHCVWSTEYVYSWVVLMCTARCRNETTKSICLLCICIFLLSFLFIVYFCLHVYFSFLLMLPSLVNKNVYITKAHNTI